MSDQLASALSVTTGSIHQVVVACEAMRALYETLRRAARTRVPVLLLGETGTGKEVLAWALHGFSADPRAPYQSVNCAAIPPTLLESTLFGHERGAFSGADRRRSGVFERAHGGTLLLDEVGELSLHAQASLLRVLETKRLSRVGGDSEVIVDVRVVGATNRDLNAMVREGAFRLDLLYRINTVTLRVPPLRERPEEIEPLARLFLQDAIRQWQLPEHRLHAELGSWLRGQRWPGNVRELKNTVERALVNARSNVLSIADFESAAETAPLELVGTLDGQQPDSLASSLDEQVRRFEAKLISEALRTTGGNQTRAAELLGVPRRTLGHKASLYGLTGQVNKPE